MPDDFDIEGFGGVLPLGMKVDLQDQFSESAERIGQEILGLLGIVQKFDREINQAGKRKGTFWESMQGSSYKEAREEFVEFRREVTKFREIVEDIAESVTTIFKRIVGWGVAIVGTYVSFRAVHRWMKEMWEYGQRFEQQWIRLAGRLDSGPMATATMEWGDRMKLMIPLLGQADELLGAIVDKMASLGQDPRRSPGFLRGVMGAAMRVGESGQSMLNTIMRIAQGGTLWGQRMNEEILKWMSDEEVLKLQRRLDSIGYGFERLGERVNVIAETFGGLFGENVTRAESTWESFVQKLQAGAEILKKTFLGGMAPEGLYVKVRDLMKRLYETLTSPAIVYAAGYLGKLLAGVVSRIDKFVESLNKRFLSTGDWLGDFAKNKVAPAVTFISIGVMKAFTSIRDFLKGLAGHMKIAWEGTIWPMLQGFGKAIGNAFSTVFGEEMTPESFGRSVGKVLEKITVLGIGVATAITTAFTHLYESVEGFVTSPYGRAALYLATGGASERFFDRKFKVASPTATADEAMDKWRQRGSDTVSGDRIGSYFSRGSVTMQVVTNDPDKFADRFEAHLRKKSRDVLLSEGKYSLFKPKFGVELDAVGF